MLYKPIVNDKNRGGLSWLRGRLAILGAVVVAFAPPTTSSAAVHLSGAFVALQQLTSSQAAKPGASDSSSGASVLNGIPGLDFSSLPSSAQRELANVFSDEFCYCGCPHTLGACLKTHPTCKHARRMAVLAASDAAAGVPAVEIILNLSRYYSSFREPRQSFKVDENLCIGKKDAKVTMVEFSDFACPHCAAARPTLEKFARENSSTMRFCFTPFPLSSPTSIPAAQAALFARDHQKFWEMHDLLFENQTRLLNADQIKALGSRLGLSVPELSKAIDSNKYADEIAAWKDAGNRAGVDATPTVFINGRKHRLSISPDTLQRTLEDEMEWVSNKNSWAPD